jgi:hypothetical protein
MSDSEKDDKLEHTKGDVAHAITKGVVSAVPFAGGLLAELMSLIWEPALSKRRDKWLGELAEKLEILKERVDGFKLEDLANNESFITTTFQATQAALRNHQEAKLEALRNAVLNSALGTALDDDHQLFFLSLVERMTVSHLQVLQLAASKEKGIFTIRSLDEKVNLTGAIAEEVNGQINKGQVQPENISFLRLIIDDLVRQDLIKLCQEPSSHYEEAFMYSNDYQAEITDIGKSFLEFITSPSSLL